MRIKQLIERGLTQEVIAVRMGCSKRHVQDVAQRMREATIARLTESD